MVLPCWELVANTVLHRCNSVCRLTQVNCLVWKRQAGRGDVQYLLYAKMWDCFMGVFTLGLISFDIRVMYDTGILDYGWYQVVGFSFIMVFWIFGWYRIFGYSRFFLLGWETWLHTLSFTSFFHFLYSHLILHQPFDLLLLLFDTCSLN